MAYLAKTGLRYPVGEHNIKKAQRGDLDKVTQWKEIEAGDVADDIPSCSLEWLLAQGHIEPVEGGAP